MRLSCFLNFAVFYTLAHTKLSLDIIICLATAEVTQLRFWSYIQVKPQIAEPNRGNTNRIDARSRMITITARFISIGQQKKQA